MENFRFESQVATEAQALLSPENLESTSVYPVIHMIRADIIHFIDTPLTYEALIAPDLTYTLIRPLHEKYQGIQHPETGDPNFSIPFALLVNRVYFLRDTGLSTHSVSRTRAQLCEVLAIRLLRDHGNNLLSLAIALTTSWSVFAGADPDTIQYAEDEYGDIPEKIGNAIEMAIIGRAKRFIKSSSCQRVIDGIWSGRCVYQAQSSHSILSDTYKQKNISFYDPHKAPLLDHYRLKVPAIRSILEYWNFVILFILFVVAIEAVERDRIVIPEILFMVYALGFALEKIAAMQEHGLQVYSKGTWNGFDLAFITVYFVYAACRLYGSIWHHVAARRFGMDCMAILACLLFPRLAFVTLRDNLMVLALRAMIIQFVVLMAIACFCFGGFLYALWILSRNSPDRVPAGQIAWWMLDLWFGLDAAGFEVATSFHPFFGPILMVTYASLSNTLLLTVLVSILSNTFSVISEDAAAEAMFRKAVSTIEGVKADSLFSYQPPLNLLALIIMLPSSYVLSPRWFHKCNVFLIRLLNLPLLLLIAVYERTAKRLSTDSLYDTLLVLGENIIDSLPKAVKPWVFFEGLMSSEADIDLLFEIEEDFGSALVIDDEDATSPYRFEVTRSPDRPRHKSPVPPTPTSSGLTPRRESATRLSPRSSPREDHPPRFYRDRAGHPHHRPHSPVRQRTRLPTLLPRAADALQNFTSPLAQIYQPLVVDEDEERADGHQSPTSSSPHRERKPSHAPVPVPMVAAGLRRRISTTKPRTPSDSTPGTSRLVKFPKIGEQSESTENVFTESPEPQSILELPKMKSPSPPPIQTQLLTAGQLTDGESSSRTAHVIEQLEEGQKRLENMLSHLIAEMKAKK